MNSLRRITFLACFLPFWTSAALAAEAGSPYAPLLKTVVTPGGVKWDVFKKQERGQLDAFLKKIADAEPGTLATRDDQLAFWINAHNACVMKLILDRMPVTDVGAIEGFRDQLKCRIAGAERSLIEIESGVIRPLFNDPKVHFALWWGAKGSPRLRPTPYQGKDLQKALDEQATAFVRSPQAVEFTKSKATLSPLFDWYKSDFGPDERGVLTFVRERLPEKEAKLIPSTLKNASFAPFDWNLDAAN